MISEVLTRERLVIVVAGLLAVTFAAALPGFRSWGNAFALLRNVSVLGVFGLGMAVVVIGRGIDLSQVTVALVSAAAAAKLVVAGAGLPASVLAGLACALSLGVTNGALIAYLRVPPLLATLASALLFAGAARLWFLRSMAIHLPPSPGTAALGGNWGGVPVPVVVLGVCACTLHLFLAHTRPGRFIYAHGDNPEAARLTGVAVRRLTLLEYALSAGTGYIASLVTASATAMVDVQALNAPLVFDAILVVVLGGVSLAGGRGGVASVLAGTLLVGALLKGMTIMDLDYQLQNAVRGLVLLATIVADSLLHPQDEETARQGI
jgi:ribose transport system permease protein